MDICYLHQWNLRVLVRPLQFREVNGKGRPPEKALPSPQVRSDASRKKKGPQTLRRLWGPGNHSPSSVA